MSDREAKEAREVEQGYQESSLREVRLREWWSGRDDPRKDTAFASLVNTLNSRRWWLRIREEGGERYERYKARQRRYQDETGRARVAARRAQELRATVISCAGCGAEFARLPGALGRLPRWCSVRCKWRHAKQQRARAREVITCRACGAQFCKAPWAAARPPSYCGADCRRAGEAAAQRARYRKERS